MAKGTLYTNATIITIDKQRRIILDGAILVNGSRIEDVGKSSALLISALENHERGEVDVVSLEGRIVIPGLINTHAHLAQSLLRGLAEDMDLHSWLCDAIWPREAVFDGNDGYTAARLTIAEMLLSGTTCFLEAMLTHRTGFENVIRAVEESGMRACLGKLVKPIESNANSGMKDARDRYGDAMSVDSAIDAFNKSDGSCN